MGHVGDPGKIKLKREKIWSQKEHLLGILWAQWSTYCLDCVNRELNPKPALLKRERSRGKGIT